MSSQIEKSIAIFYFARINKSFIVNVTFIKSVDTDFITLEKKEISLGRTYKEDFMNQFIKGNLLKR
ncbi:MAG: DNA-binding LytR/AlgR family response regulator [Maribacter sp.]|jgi:DNA-binding LytR/AlgR family response regulator